MWPFSSTETIGYSVDEISGMKKTFERNEEVISEYLGENVPNYATADFNGTELEGRDEIAEAFNTITSALEEDDYIIAEVEKGFLNRGNTRINIKAGEIEEATASYKTAVPDGWKAKPNSGYDKPQYSVKSKRKTKDSIPSPNLAEDEKLKEWDIANIKVGEPVFELEIEYEEPDAHL
jgi:hypothetical protein